MSDISTAGDVETGEPVSVVTLPPTERGTSAMDLARMLGEQRRKRDDEQSPAAANDRARSMLGDKTMREKPSGAPQAQKPPPEPAPPADADAAPPQEAPGEATPEDAEPADEAPIPLPRSWKREQADHWATLPRETQAYILQRQDENDRAVRQTQNEAAERLKSLTAKEQLVEQARQFYEQNIPQLQHALQSHIATEFSDIKSMTDARLLAQVDPQRYSQWDAAQKELHLANEAAQKAQTRAQEEYQQQWNKWSAEQDRLFSEKAPEIADPVQGPALKKQSFEALKKLGFTEDELAQSWNSGQLRDHRVQLLILRNAKLEAAEASAKKAAAKPVPQVQRPGVSRPRGAADSDAADALSQQLDKRGDAKTAAALLMARRNARA